MVFFFKFCHGSGQTLVNVSCQFYQKSGCYEIIRHFRVIPQRRLYLYPWCIASTTSSLCLSQRLTIWGLCLFLHVPTFSTSSLLVSLVTSSAFSFFVRQLNRTWLSLSVCVLFCKGAWQRIQEKAAVMGIHVEQARLDMGTPDAVASWARRSWKGKWSG